MVVFNRASRDFDFVPALGSALTVWQYDLRTRILGTEVKFDIEQGRITETFRNKNTTHSGSNGADLYTRVGMGWTFALVLNFPARLDVVTAEQAQAGPALAAPFPHTILGISQGVRMRFDIGDPLFWTSLGLSARCMIAAKAKLESIETRLDSNGLETVGLNIAGVGSSLLWTCLEAAGGVLTPLHPGLWS